jgi:cytoskeletal protein CcmA (bactofilin family)
MALFKNDVRPATAAAPPPPAPVYAPPPEPPAVNSPEESVLSPNVAITGDVTFEGSMRIEGKITGKIIAQGRLTVARGAQILGEVTAAEAIIEGIVQGNVNATDRIELRSGAQVVGDIRAQRLVVQDGAKLLGQHDIDSESLTNVVRPAAAPAAPAARPSAPAPAHASAHAAAKGDPLAQAF